MQKILDQYTYRMTWSDEDNQCVGLCAEFPRLSWLDATPEKALRGIRKVVAEVVADMQASGESVPEPINHCRYSGKFMVRVPPEVHRKLALEAAESFESADLPNGPPFRLTCPTAETKIAGTNLREWRDSRGRDGGRR